MNYKKVGAIYEAELQQLRSKMSAAYTEYYSPKVICAKCGKQFACFTPELSLLCPECFLSELKQQAK